MTEVACLSEEALAQMELRTVVGFYRLGYFNSEELLKLALIYIDHDETSEMLLELILEDAPSYEERCSAFGRFFH